MKQFLFFFFFLIPFGIFSQGWQEFQDINGRFSVTSPANLTEKVDSIETEVGELVYHTFFYQADEKTADNLFYMVSYVDYPEASIHSDSTELLSDFFETTIQTATESVKGTLLYAGEAQFKEYPGRVWRIEYLENKVAIKTKAYMVNNRFYSIQTIAFKDKSLNKAAEDFFESFRLL